MSDKIFTSVTKPLLETLGKPKNGTIEAIHASYARKLLGFEQKDLEAAVFEYLDNRRFETWPKPLELEQLALSKSYERQDLVFVPRGEHPDYTPEWVAMAAAKGKNPQTMTCTQSENNGNQFGWYFPKQELKTAMSARRGVAA